MQLLKRSHLIRLRWTIKSPEFGLVYYLTKNKIFFQSLKTEYFGKKNLVKWGVRSLLILRHQSMLIFYRPSSYFADGISDFLRCLPPLPILCQDPIPDIDIVFIWWSKTVQIMFCEYWFSLTFNLYVWSMSMNKKL